MRWARARRPRHLANTPTQRPPRRRVCKRKTATALLPCTWNAPSDNGGAQITGYIVEYTGGTITATTNHATLTGLTNGDAITAKVFAVNRERARRVFHAGGSNCGDNARRADGFASARRQRRYYFAMERAKRQRRRANDWLHCGIYGRHNNGNDQPRHIDGANQWQCHNGKSICR